MGTVINCRTARESFSEYLDSALDAGPRAALQEHLAGCADCRRELERWRSAVRAVAELPRRPAPEGLCDRLMRLVADDSPLATRAPRIVALWPRLASVAAMFVMVAAITFGISRNGALDLLQPDSPRMAAVRSHEIADKLPALEGEQEIASEEDEGAVTSGERAGILDVAKDAKERVEAGQPPASGRRIGKAGVPLEEKAAKDRQSSPTAPHAERGRQDDLTLPTAVARVDADLDHLRGKGGIEALDRAAGIPEGFDGDASGATAAFAASRFREAMEGEKSDLAQQKVLSWHSRAPGSPLEVADRSAPGRARDARAITILTDQPLQTAVEIGRIAGLNGIQDVELSVVDPAGDLYVTVSGPAEACSRLLNGLFAKTQLKPAYSARLTDVVAKENGRLARRSLGKSLPPSGPARPANGPREGYFPADETAATEAPPLRSLVAPEGPRQVADAGDDAEPKQQLEGAFREPTGRKEKDDEPGGVAEARGLMLDAEGGTHLRLVIHLVRRPAAETPATDAQPQPAAEEAH